MLEACEFLDTSYADGDSFRMRVGNEVLAADSTMPVRLVDNVAENQGENSPAL